mgnify:CR=1 FL=1
MNERDQRIVDVIRALDEGEVTTYGHIAEVAGYPGRSRLVGSLLASGGDELDLAREIHADRSLPGDDPQRLIALIQQQRIVEGHRSPDRLVGCQRVSRFHRREL